MAEPKFIWHHTETVPPIVTKVGQSDNVIFRFGRFCLNPTFAYNFTQGPKPEFCWPFGWNRKDHWQACSVYACLNLSFWASFCPPACSLPGSDNDLPSILFVAKE